jgi:hypothetical protein
VPGPYGDSIRQHAVNTGGAAGSLDSMDWQTDWYPGGGDGNVVVATSFCNGLSLTFVAPTVSGSTILPFVSFGVQFASSFGTYPYDWTLTSQLDFHFGAAEPFVKVVTFGSGPWTGTLRGDAHPHALTSGFEVRCKTVGTGEVRYVTAYPGVNTTGAMPALVCNAIGVAWPKFPLLSGVPATFSVTLNAGVYVGGINSLAIEDRQDPAAPVVTAITSVADSTSGAALGYSPPLGAGSYSFTYTPTRQLGIGDVELHCVGGTVPVERHFWPGATPSITFPGGDPDQESALAVCMDSVLTDMSLTSPSTWVGGLLGGGRCVAVFLFVPSQTAVDSLKDAGSNALTHAPMSFVAEGISTTAGAYNALKSSLDASSSTCFNALNDPSSIDTGGAGVGVVTVCASDMPSGMDAIRPFLVWLFWIGFSWALLWSTLELMG